MCQFTDEDIKFFEELGRKRHQEDERKERLAALRNGGGPDYGASLIHAICLDEPEQQVQGDDS